MAASSFCNYVNAAGVTPLRQRRFMAADPLEYPIGMPFIGTQFFLP